MRNFFSGTPLNVPEEKISTSLTRISAENSRVSLVERKAYQSTPPGPPYYTISRKGLGRSGFSRHKICSKFVKKTAKNVRGRRGSGGVLW